MEDPTSWEGWTTPAPQPGLDLGFPEGRRLAPSAPSGWVGEIRASTRATDDTIKYAARIWPQVQPDDFDREGRRYVERATGIPYQLVHGNPMMADDAAVADCFFAEDGSLWFLRRADRSEARSQYMGTVSGRQS